MRGHGLTYHAQHKILHTQNSLIKTFFFRACKNMICKDGFEPRGIAKHKQCHSKGKYEVWDMLRSPHPATQPSHTA